MEPLTTELKKTCAETKWANARDCQWGSDKRGLRVDAIIVAGILKAFALLSLRSLEREASDSTYLT